MSSASVTSSKREKQASELKMELESVKAVNNCLNAYLQHLRGLKRCITDTKDNFSQLSKVNQQWIDTINIDRK